MPNPMFHFSVGSVVGVTTVGLIYASRHWLHRNTKWMKQLYKKQRWWMLYSPFVIMSFGFWALIPNMLFVLGIVDREWTHSSQANIFFFKAWIEEIEHSISIEADVVLSRIGEAAAFLVYGGAIFFLILFIGQCESAYKKIRSQKIHK